MRLATWIFITILCVLILALVNSLVAAVSAYRFETYLKTVVAENLASVTAAEELEIALLEQRGRVSAYVLDRGNAIWLQELGAKNQAFRLWLERARRAARTEDERKILDQLEKVQSDYAAKRQEVVDLYDAGEKERATQVLLHDVDDLYQQAYGLCEAFIQLNHDLVEATSDRTRRQVEQVTFAVTAILAVSLGLGIALLWFIFRGVIFPLRRMSAEARLASGVAGPERPSEDRNELRDLGRALELLTLSVTEARDDLERSRTQLAVAEKLAAVGKLAASVAHEIRNPLTSMKMWLFSLRRSIGDNAECHQKLDVVTDEANRLENIIHQFLEFSRPPQLRLSQQSVSRLLDKTLELLRPRLDEHRIEVQRQDDAELPTVLADPDQMRQVLLNLINNAVDAMPAGGVLKILAGKGYRESGPMAVVRVHDSGGGMSPEVHHRVFEPFYTTKADGTGLGLSIAASVMARHGGKLELVASDAQGTQFAVWIPAWT